MLWEQPTKENQMTTAAPIEVLIPGLRSKFQDWITNRGGVQVWVSQNLSYDAGRLTFNPQRDAAGNENKAAPHWSLKLQEVVTDISRFRFANSYKELQRCKIAIQHRRNNTLMLELTSGSTNRVRKILAKLHDAGHKEAFYEFDYDSQEAVFQVPVWEASAEPIA
jgi:hypothetical protein